MPERNDSGSEAQHGRRGRQECVGRASRFPAHTFIGRRKERQIFNQHFIRGDNGGAFLLDGKIQSSAVGAIGEISQSYPKKRVGEKRRHTSRFGQP